MPGTIRLRAADAAALPRDGWWELANLRKLLGGQAARVMAHDFGPDPKAPAYAFLAADAGTARRFFAVLGGTSVVEFDLSETPSAWHLEGSAAGWRYRGLLPEAGAKAGADREFLNVLAPGAEAAESLVSLDLAGVRVGQQVALFHRENGMARASVYFDLESKGKLGFLVAGLAPGLWEVWWNGYLEREMTVRPQAGTLWFEGEAGSYFLKRLA